MIELNSGIQSALLVAINQSSTQTKALTIRAVLKAQASASNATFLLNHASSLAQSASTLANSQVSMQLSLLNDMISLANSTIPPISRFKLAKVIANRTQQAISFSQSQISTELSSLSASNNALLRSTDTETQIQILEVIVSQTIAYTPESASNIVQLFQLVTDMEATATNMSNALNSTLLVANAAKQAAIQADAAQAIALTLSLKAGRLALCYPNPCLNGGMCAGSIANFSVTCFCPSIYKGSLCQYLKATSVFNIGRGFSNYESMVRVEDINQEKM
jgi:hypothetical protein